MEGKVNLCYKYIILYLITKKKNLWLRSENFENKIYDQFSEN